MTAAALSGLAKEEIIPPAQVAEPDAVQIPSHVSKEIFNASHMKMVPLLYGFLYEAIQKFSGLLRPPARSM